MTKAAKKTKHDSSSSQDAKNGLVSLGKEPFFIDSDEGLQGSLRVIKLLVNSLVSAGNTAKE